MNTNALLLGACTVATVMYFYVLAGFDTLTAPNSDQINIKSYLPFNHQKDDDHASFFHHIILSDESVHERIKNTNSSQYTWVGNHWMPPPGVPTFTARQLKAYYSQRNILVIGDSTSRRLYTTLFDLINANDLDDMKAREIEGDHWKRKNSCSEDLGDRYITRMSGRKQVVCQNNTSEVEDENGDGNVTKHYKFDHITQYCYDFLEWYWRTGESFSAEFSQSYDLIIIGVGVWEQNFPDICKKNLPGTTSEERLQKSFQNMEENNPADLQVVFRTSAFDTRFANDDNQLIRSTNALSRQFFYDLDQKSELGRYEKNLTLVDWGGVMETRSYGEDRIVGDHAAHYGLEARLLAIQQVTHELVKSELIARDFQRNEHKSSLRSSQNNFVGA